MKLENTKLYESAQLGVSSDSGLTSLLSAKQGQRLLCGVTATPPCVTC